MVAETEKKIVNLGKKYEFKKSSKYEKKITN